MIKEEFELAQNAPTAYCKEKGYVLDDFQYEIDSAAIYPADKLWHPVPDRKREEMCYDRRKN